MPRPAIPGVTPGPLSSAAQNDLIDRVNDNSVLLDQTFDDWTAFVPVLRTGTTEVTYGTNPTKWGRLRASGALVEFFAVIIYGASSNTASGQLVLDLPVPGAITAPASTFPGIRGRLTNMSTRYFFLGEPVSSDRANLYYLTSNGGTANMSRDNPTSLSGLPAFLIQGSYYIGS